MAGSDAFFIELIDSIRVTNFRLFSANDREFTANFKFMNTFFQVFRSFHTKVLLEKREV